MKFRPSSLPCPEPWVWNQADLSWDHVLPLQVSVNSVYPSVKTRLEFPPCQSHRALAGRGKIQCGSPFITAESWAHLRF